MVEWPSRGREQRLPAGDLGGKAHGGGQRGAPLAREGLEDFWIFSSLTRGPQGRSNSRHEVRRATFCTSAKSLGDQLFDHHSYGRRIVSVTSFLATDSLGAGNGVWLNENRREFTLVRTAQPNILFFLPSRTCPCNPVECSYFNAQKLRVWFWDGWLRSKFFGGLGMVSFRIAFTRFLGMSEMCDPSPANKKGRRQFLAQSPFWAHFWLFEPTFFCPVVPGRPQPPEQKLITLTSFVPLNRPATSLPHFSNW